MNVRGNILLRFISGKLGGLVGRMWKGRPYLSKAPTFPKNRKFSKMQMEHQERFQDAAAYAKGAIRDEASAGLYAVLAEKYRLTSYNVALRDFFRAPKVREIDASSYTGKRGEEIVIRAVDDVEVLRVHVIIRKNGEVLEEGDAVREKYNKTLWHYEAQKDLGIEGCLIEVQAEDRPGNVTVKEFAL
ncbi:MAG: hypothetical protein LN415_08120 [Candidatus Thermoplasmatota archaeon]|nr:hypothetical protein [Candidatus Thermoplasmatota archaeon]